MKKSRGYEIYNDINELDKDNELNIDDILMIEEMLNDDPNFKTEIPENLFINIMDSIEEVINIENKERSIEENNLSKIYKLLYTIRNQISLMNKEFWIISIILILAGGLFLSIDNDLLVFLAPIVSIYSIYHLYRGVYYNTSELESTCKYSLYEMIVARTIIIVVYNIVIMNIFATLDLLLNGTNVYMLLIYVWLCPMLLSYSIGIDFYYRFNSVVYSFIAQVVIWCTHIYVFKNYLLSFVGIEYNNLIGISIVSLIIVIINMVSFFRAFIKLNTCKE